MHEESVFFKGGSLAIEGRYLRGVNRGAVITHPHPQMGGSMHNNVVDALVAAFGGSGFSTLRFNFRGVGRSEGTYDNGRGEQEDVLGALSFLAAQGVDQVILAGYSFGAWVNAKLADRRELFAEFIMVSPPLDFLSFDIEPLAGTCGLVVCGDRDQFCPLPRLRKAAGIMGCPVKIVPGADHFYSGTENALIREIQDYLAPVRPDEDF